MRFGDLDRLLVEEVAEEEHRDAEGPFDVDRRRERRLDSGDEEPREEEDVSDRLRDDHGVLFQQTREIHHRDHREEERRSDAEQNGERLDDVRREIGAGERDGAADDELADDHQIAARGAVVVRHHFRRGGVIHLAHAARADNAEEENADDAGETVSDGSHAAAAHGELGKARGIRAADEVAHHEHNDQQHRQVLARHQEADLAACGGLLFLLDLRPTADAEQQREVNDDDDQ